MIYSKRVEKLSSRVSGERVIILSGSVMYDKRKIAEQLIDYSGKSRKGAACVDLRDRNLLRDIGSSTTQLTNYIDPEVFDVVILDNFDSTDSALSVVNTVVGEDRFVTIVILSSRKVDREIFSNIGEIVFEEIGTPGFNDYCSAVMDSEKSTGRNEMLQNYFRFGTYPAVISAENDDARIELLNNLINNFINIDVEREGVRNPDSFYLLMQRIAENTGGLLNSNELADNVGVSVTAVENYLAILEDYFFIKRVRPFYGRFRKELKKMPKAYYLDTGIRNALIDNFNPLDKRMDRNACFENLVLNQFLDLTCEENIKFWRTQTKHEIDFVVEERFAVDTRYNAKNFKDCKYIKFKENYQEIPLLTVGCEELLNERIPSMYKIENSGSCSAPLIIPPEYDYIGIYLTEKCHLNCDYCITRHHDAPFGEDTGFGTLTPSQWIRVFNRMEMPEDVPITLQGGEPFLYKGIWEVLEGCRHKIDIMTALPPFLKREDFLNLKTLQWNKRGAPYPTIRVSYHQGQHNYVELVDRIAELNDLLSIGLYYLKHPANDEADIQKLTEYAEKQGVELRSKEFLGYWNGKQYGTFLYEGAADGIKKDETVYCKNTVVPVAPDGTIFRCHSDLYFGRKELALGSVLDENFSFPGTHQECNNYGLCNECDVKVKTNHYQVFGYTSVDIKRGDSNDSKK